MSIASPNNYGIISRKDGEVCCSQEALKLPALSARDRNKLFCGLILAEDDDDELFYERILGVSQIIPYISKNQLHKLQLDQFEFWIIQNLTVILSVQYTVWASSICASFLSPAKGSEKGIIILSTNGASYTAGS